MPPNYTLRPSKLEDYLYYRALHHEVLRDTIEPIWGWSVRTQNRITRKEFKPSDIDIIQNRGKDIGVLQVEDKGGVPFYFPNMD